MRCRLADRLPGGKDWVYEIKFDGFRGLALKNRNEIRLISRNNRDLSHKFPEVVRALRKLPYDQLMLDGELVALDPTGRSSFQLLQSQDDQAKQAASLFFYVFDLLNLNGRDTSGLPLLTRKALLKQVIKTHSDSIRFSDVLAGSPVELTSMVQGMGLEGLIAKKSQSKYESGLRSGSWVKVKWGFEQEFVIGGYTTPEGSRPYFGAILVGYYAGPKLQFAGKVGTGFNTRLLKSLYDRFETIRMASIPFSNLPERNPFLSRAQMRACKWIRPELVCQVRFTEWTRDGILRQPVFLGLREDKDPREVVKEVVQGSTKRD